MEFVDDAAALASLEAALADNAYYVKYREKLSALKASDPATYRRRLELMAKQAADAVNGAVQGNRSTRKQRRHRRLKPSDAEDGDEVEESPSPEPSPVAARRGKPAPVEYDL